MVGNGGNGGLGVGRMPAKSSFLISAQDQLSGFSAGAFQRQGGHPHGGQMRRSDGIAVWPRDWELFLCSRRGAVQFQKVSVLQVWLGQEDADHPQSCISKINYLFSPPPFDLQFMLQFKERGRDIVMSPMMSCTHPPPARFLRFLKQMLV